MTKLRKPLSIEFVLSQALTKLDANEVKNSTGKTMSHFRKCSDPDDKDHALYLSDAIKLDILMQRKSLGTPLLDNFQLMLEREFKKINSFPDLIYLIFWCNKNKSKSLSNYFNNNVNLTLLLTQFFYLIIPTDKHINFHKFLNRH